mmetsp:Transcript_54367/g.101949  ORF Transcript_54367/g.101949 Transcript_54367/m.101949 type:complete len:214 (-) Transcript_54367:781-1422(-)
MQARPKPCLTFPGTPEDCSCEKQREDERDNRSESCAKEAVNKRKLRHTEGDGDRKCDHDYSHGPVGPRARFHIGGKVLEILDGIEDRHGIERHAEGDVDQDHRCHDREDPMCRRPSPVLRGHIECLVEAGWRIGHRLHHILLDKVAIPKVTTTKHCHVQQTAGQNGGRHCQRKLFRLLHVPNGGRCHCLKSDSTDASGKYQTQGRGFLRPGRV